MNDLKNRVDWLQTLGQMKKGLTLVREEVVVKGWPSGQPQETDCMACMDYVTSEQNPIIYCSKCNNSFHQLCIGLATVPQEEYYCDQCQHGKGQEVCAECDQGWLCLVRAGDQWFHPVCLVLSSRVVMQNK